jgi:hypothetical protein
MKLKWICRRAKEDEKCADADNNGATGKRRSCTEQGEDSKKIKAPW